MTEISIPPQFAGKVLENLTLDDLLEVSSRLQRVEFASLSKYSLAY
jgi:hypothetical protein